MKPTTFVLLLVVAACMLGAASWGLATARVGDMLGAPPPEMGKSDTKLRLGGDRELKGHPRDWRFHYAPTMLPGAPEVTIWVDLTGHVLRTSPANLPDILRTFHSKGY